MFDSTLIGVISDLFINLAAGWIGALVILPTRIYKQKRKKRWALIVNSVCATMALVVSYQLRRLSSL